MKDPTSEKEEMVQKLEALVQAEAKKKNSHRILLAVQSKDKSQLDFRQCIGTDANNRSSQDPYFIASQTKMMTATVIFQLVDEGRLKLDDKITQYLPADMTDNLHVYKGKDYSSSIEIHHLIHQTSGLPDFFLQKDKTTRQSVWDIMIANQDMEWTRDDYVQKAKSMSPQFAPGANEGRKTFYSDTNYQLLGAIIEQVTHKTIAENFEARIFQPLQLSKKTYVYDHQEQLAKEQPPMPLYYKEKELHIPPIMSSFPADGGVVSTLDDMLVFLRAYFDGKLFDKRQHSDFDNQQWNTIFGVPPLQYGDGLMRFKIPKWMTLWCFASPPALYGHSGSNASFAFYAPDKDVFIVGTFNQLDQESRPFPFMLQVLQCLK